MAAFTDTQAEERKDQKRAIGRAKLFGLNKDAALRQLLKSREGRDYLRWLLMLSGAIGRTPSSEFDCGMHFIGSQVVNHIIEVDPQFLVLILKENEDGRPDPQPDADAGADPDDPSGNFVEPGNYD